jgi:guanylate kinase
MQKLLGNLKKGLLFVVSAPSGAGKTTLVAMLTKEFPEIVFRSVTCTTRPPRAEEVDGRDYHFLSEAVFKKKTEEGEFLEHATVFGYRYGTLQREVEAKQNEGKHVILVIDTQGAMFLKERVPALFIFIAPPSLEVLKGRLEQRKTDRKDGIEERVEWAKREMKQSPKYDYLIVNDELPVAYEVLKSIIIAEEHRWR